MYLSWRSNGITKTKNRDNTKITNYTHSMDTTELVRENNEINRSRAETHKSSVTNFLSAETCMWAYLEPWLRFCKSLKKLFLMNISNVSVLQYCRKLIWPSGSEKHIVKQYYINISSRELGTLVGLFRMLIPNSEKHE